MYKEMSDQEHFERLQSTLTFRNGGHFRWAKSRLTVVGAGTLGERFASEAVLSGAAVHVYDFDRSEALNLGTQRGQVGVPKVASLVARCDAVRLGRALGFQSDIRHVGIGFLADSRLIADCSDNPALEPWLTEVSNGLGIPKLRLAVDGSGQYEMGRVSCSHGATSACGICHYSVSDLMQKTQRTACPGQNQPRRPTLVGGALASAIAGTALLQAQRLVTGNDIQLVLNHQLVLDLTHFQLLSLETPRSEKCLSGHVRWDLCRLERNAKDTTFLDLIRESEQRLRKKDVMLEPYSHGLCTRAFCECGSSCEVIGTVWVEPPSCAVCNRPMQWVAEKLITELNKATIQALGIQDIPVVELGLPARGAMIVARAPKCKPLRMVLE